MAIPEDEQPRGTRHWAKVWKVHRNTACVILKCLNRRYGSTMVWRVPYHNGTIGHVASEASLRPIRVERVHRNMVIITEEAGGAKVMVMPSTGRSHLVSPRKPEVEDESVTQEQFSRALGEIWRMFERLGVKRGG
jgi:hypothetical protein